MKKNGKKIFLITIIAFILLTIVIVGGMLYLIKIEKLALTKEQKINKGINEIAKNIEEKNLTKKYIEEKMSAINSDTNTFTLTANVNEFDMKYFNGYKDILDEIKDMINNTKISSTIEKNSEDKTLNQKFSIEVGNVINSLSEEFIYNTKQMGFRIEELNSKYILIDKDAMKVFYPEYIYNGVFETFDKVFNINIKNLELTDEEIEYFVENYKNIILENIKIDSIEEKPTTIMLNGKQRNCSEVTIRLDNEQFSKIFTDILEKFEEDEKGKNILISKLILLNEDFNINDLEDTLEEIETDMPEIKETEFILKLYCNYLNTYGYEIEKVSTDNNFKIRNLFDNDYNEIEISNGESSINIVNRTKELQINSMLKNDEERIHFVYNEKDGIGEGRIDFLGLSNKMFNIGINTNFKNIKDVEISLNTKYEDSDNNIDITFNIRKTMENTANNINKQLNNTNSIDIFSYTNEEMEEYINTVFNNLDKLINIATNNSNLLGIYYRFFSSQISEALNLSKNSLIEMFKQDGNLGWIKYNTSLYVDYQGADIFNSPFLELEGDQIGLALDTLKESVDKINETNQSHKIELDSDYEFGNSSQDFEKYNVKFEYDEDGYINKIIVRKK